MITPEIPAEATERNDSVTARLRGLVGGSLTVGEISIDQASDPDEDSALSSERIPGLKDRIDILGAYIKMDPVEIGILTKQVFPSTVHKMDRKAVEYEIQQEKRAEETRKSPVK